ncbi:dihydrofolate reductase [Ginsengibacter hankyongi]|uniref:Dihydrofolate reductase n=1 Tax=Ginsengibacter hankyongi TaxID=2607284 RepID=A0A5J5IHV6_9BACT|nr:dihydrofolate reductase [Ginsengibacter hankyongi]KAA9039263.1 dihydrofolate reductase [Ginsengibacter hankyongi]
MKNNSEKVFLAHIVAASENNVIGANGDMPWHLPNDFKYFKNKTWGMPVIMGRKSYEALKESLPGRINIVITKKTDFHPKDALVFNNIEDAITKAKESDAKEIFIIGGGEIFKQTIDIVSRIYLTRVHATIEGDTYYPEINKNIWKLVSAQSFPADDKNNYPYTFEVWEKNIDAS